MSAEAMTEDRAREIVGAICAFSFYTQDVMNEAEFYQQVGDKLKNVTLGQMLEASRIVDAANRRTLESPAGDGVRKLTVIPDDRLIAAVYVATRYERQRAAGKSMLEPIISVPPAGMHDKSYLLLVSFTKCN